MSHDPAALLAEAAGEARDAAAAAADLAAAWSADPDSVAAILRYRAARARAAEPAPDSCVMLDRMKLSYAAYAAAQNADPAAVTRFEAAEARYDEALRRIAQAG